MSALRCKYCGVAEMGKRTDAAHSELRHVVAELQAGRRVDASQVLGSGVASSLSLLLDHYSRAGYGVVWDGPLLRVIAAAQARRHGDTGVSGS